MDQRLKPVHTLGDGHQGGHGSNLARATVTPGRAEQGAYVHAEGSAQILIEPDSGGAVQDHMDLMSAVKPQVAKHDVETWVARM